MVGGGGVYRRSSMAPTNSWLNVDVIDPFQLSKVIVYAYLFNMQSGGADGGTGWHGVFLFQWRWSLSSPPELEFRPPPIQQSVLAATANHCSSGGFFPPLICIHKQIIKK